MKTTIKRIIPLLVMTGTLVGCSAHGYKPGPVEDLVGLYELEIIKKKHNVDDQDTYDYKSEIKAKAYFTINKDGYGYYGYKDKNTPARVDQVFSNFEYDTDDEAHPDYVESISMTDGITHKMGYEKEAGCLDEPPLGFHDTALKKYLEYTIPYYTYTITVFGHKSTYTQYYQYVQYKKIGNDVSLKKVNELMGTKVSFKKPYEMKAMNRFMLYYCSANTEAGAEESRFGFYDYLFLDTDSYKNGYIDMYSKEKEGEATVTKVKVAVSNKGYSVTVRALGKDFINGPASKLTSSLSTSYEYDLVNDKYIYERFDNYLGNATTPEELITELTTSV